MKILEKILMFPLIAISLITLFGNMAYAQTNLDDKLSEVLINAGFTGKIESTLEQRLGRPINTKLADLGRLLWFDKIGALHSDNACGGCHSPSNGFGDSQSIAIGIQNNNLVGKHRTGPRNQRHTPTAVNTAFYPSRVGWVAAFYNPTWMAPMCWVNDKAVNPTYAYTVYFS